MNNIDMQKLDYYEPIQIGEGVYWVGYSDDQAGLHCNPYLIVDGDEVVLIDGGSRDDFSTVMLKIMRLGIDPKQINRLIYQHFDPDLCGNLPHLEAIIPNPDLQIISHKENNVFINYYSSKTPKLCIEKIGYVHTFKSGRRLEFYRTPYAHCPGSFITFDTKTKTVFTSDIFGSYDIDWHLYKELSDKCHDCIPQSICHEDDRKCPLHGILQFHRQVMNSSESLRYALEQVERLNPSLIAPQHGSLISKKRDIETIIKRLKEEKYIGFEYYIQEKINGKS